MRGRYTHGVDATRGYDLSVERGAARTTVHVRGRVDVTDAGHLLKDLGGELARADALDLDLSAVDYFDSSGGAVLLLLRRQVEQKGGELDIVASRPEIDQLLELIEPSASEAPVADSGAALGRRLQTTAGALLTGGREVVVFTGEVALGLVDAMVRPHKVRWRETLVEVQRAGADSLPIVALISFLIGMITAFQAVNQLRQFGAELYVANLVGLSMVRELGPLMTAIIASGRSGASYAAEIGTMKVSEEVDALVTLGFDRTRFLITPKVIALVLMLPCLTIFSDIVGIFGGLIVSDVWMDMGPNVYLRQLQYAVRTVDFTSGIVKSVVFGVLIAGVGCLRGLQARGGAESVGQVTTSAVVTCLTLIIAFDAVFSILFYYLGV